MSIGLSAWEVMELPGPGLRTLIRSQIRAPFEANLFVNQIAELDRLFAPNATYPEPGPARMLQVQLPGHLLERQQVLELRLGSPYDCSERGAAARAYRRAR